MEVKNETYLAHHGVKGQKWGVRKAQYEHGRRLYKSGHTITSNDEKIASIRRTGRVMGRAASVGTTIGLAVGVAAGKVNIPHPWLTIPVASLVVDAGVRGTVNRFTAPYRLQNASMRVYRNNPENRRSFASTQDRTRSTGNDLYDFTTNRGKYDITGKENERRQSERLERLRGRPTY